MSNRYLVVDIPPSGPDKGKITKVWDYDLTRDDAELLKKRIANRRLSKWPAVLDHEKDRNHPHVEDERTAFPTSAEMAILGINKVFDDKPRSIAPVSSTPIPPPIGWSEEQRTAAAASAAAAAVQADNAAAPVVPPMGAPADLVDLNAPTLITISVGWMGDPSKWCWSFTEYADDGGFGPYESEEAVRAGVAAELAETPYTIDVVIREMKTTTPVATVPDALVAETSRHPIDR